MNYWEKIYKNIKSYVEILSKEYIGNKIILTISSSNLDLVISNIEQISKGDYEINLEKNNTIKKIENKKRKKKKKH